MPCRAFMRSLPAGAVPPPRQTRLPHFPVVVQTLLPWALAFPLVLAPAYGQGLKPYAEAISGTLVKFDMVPVPGGKIEMANPEKAGETLTVELKSFWIGKTEVTWDEFDVYMYRLDVDGGRGYEPPERGQEPKEGEGLDGVSRPTKPYGAPDEGFGHKGYAALHINYYAAQCYCKWLSRKTGRKYRLPTEVEWEYACRAGLLPEGPIQDPALLDRMAWYWDNSEMAAHPVGTKEPNAWGLHDMLGNASEWCQGLGKEPVVRGGSYLDRAEAVHPAAREVNTPDWNLSDPQDPKSRWWLANDSFIGFRVVCEP